MYIPLVYCWILNVVCTGCDDPEHWNVRERAYARRLHIRAINSTVAVDSRAAALNTRIIIETRHINKRDYSCTMVVNETVDVARLTTYIRLHFNPRRNF